MEPGEPPSDSGNVVTTPGRTSKGPRADIKECTCVTDCGTRSVTPLTSEMSSRNGPKGVWPGLLPKQVASPASEILSPSQWQKVIALEGGRWDLEGVC